MIVINMNLQENIRRILREETSDVILAIKNILELTVMKDYEDLICDIDVDILEDYQYKYWVGIKFLKEQDSRTHADYSRYIKIMYEAEDLIYDYTNIRVYVMETYVKQCD